MRLLSAFTAKVLPAASRPFLLGLGLLMAALSSASAHPHVFVEARSKLVFDDAGLAVAIQHVFRFDDAFSAFAIQGFDKDGDGHYSREELSELAKVNVESMADYGYFTFGDNTRVEFDFGAPTDYWLEVVKVPLKDYWVMKPEDFEAMEEDVRMNGGSMPEDVNLLELHFTLPFKQPSDAKDLITLDVYDPTYYVDFRFGAGDDALGTKNAPGTCRVSRKEPPPLDDAEAYALAQIGADQRDLPPELQSVAASQVNQMLVACGDAIAAANSSSGTPEGATPDTTSTRSDATSSTSNPPSDAAAAISAALDTAKPAEQAEQVAQQAAAPKAGFLDTVFGTIAVKQKEFYQALVASLRSFRNNPHAAWLLMGLSFAYGIFHAAGPGHGKAIITSYVVANNETLRKGIILSFASAFAQAVTAIVLVGGLAVVFNLTSIAIQDTARWFEIGSYVLITGLGGWLLWQKALRPLAVSLAARQSGSEFALAGASAAGHHGHGHSHDGHHHHHGHDHHHHHEIGADGVCATCGHAHAPTPDMLQGRITLGRAVSIIFAVGLRPCTGALVVLVFALSQGMIAAGIASTLAMAVGTGITVSLLAGMAVGAKELAVRLFGEGSPMARKVHRTIEIVGAAIVFLLGLTLLIATFGWG
ncbi:HoxN/HupN/NixA family nickel/cobalt transporter [Roseibium sp. FZY0029]|uniref:HoxN/HupN/NixA family nickel/cobalt transporter n=1 Tax=Roseibium sp. FZY0029 TaxID=3116647 RepID=UPI003FA6C337